jgi:hypothetical protein
MPLNYELKIGRARKHLDDLNAEIAGWLDGYLCSLRQEYDPDARFGRGWEEWRAAVTSQLWRRCRPGSPRSRCPQWSIRACCRPWREWRCEPSSPRRRALPCRRWRQR